MIMAVTGYVKYNRDMALIILNYVLHINTMLIIKKTPVFNRC